MSILHVHTLFCMGCLESPCDWCRPIDPSLYLYRFADRLLSEEEPSTRQAVANTALRMVSSMKRDWMQTGRRPSGICGAALFIAVHIHGERWPSAGLFCTSWSFVKQGAVMLPSANVDFAALSTWAEIALLVNPQLQTCITRGSCCGMQALTRPSARWWLWCTLVRAP